MKFLHAQSLKTEYIYTAALTAINLALERPQPGEIVSAHDDTEKLIAHVEAVAGPAPKDIPTEVIALGRAITQGITDRYPPNTKGICLLRPGKTDIDQDKVDEEEAYIIDEREATAAEMMSLRFALPPRATEPEPAPDVEALPLRAEPPPEPEPAPELRLTTPAPDPAPYLILAGSVGTSLFFAYWAAIAFLFFFFEVLP